MRTFTIILAYVGILLFGYQFATYGYPPYHDLNAFTLYFGLFFSAISIPFLIPERATTLSVTNSTRKVLGDDGELVHCANCGAKEYVRLHKGRNLCASCIAQEERMKANVRMEEQRARER